MPKKKKIRDPTEGEEFIGDYLDSKGISYKREYTIYKNKSRIRLFLYS